VAPDTPPSPELVGKGTFNFRNLFETYLVHNGGKKNIDATSFDNLWKAIRNKTVERTQQMLHMEKEITISGIDV
jgi:hypothetical protein